MIRILACCAAGLVVLFAMVLLIAKSKRTKPKLGKLRMLVCGHVHRV